MRKILLALSCLSLLTPMFLIAATASAPYDAWYDLDADGDIDIFDMVRIAGTYGTTGDPGKNVNVTNWPANANVNVTNWPTTVPVFVRGYAYSIITLQSDLMYPEDWWLFEIDTRGYRQITLGIFAADPTEFRVQWCLGETMAPYFYETFTTIDIGTLKTYDVRGQQLRIDVWDRGTLPIYEIVYLDIYLTA